MPTAFPPAARPLAMLAALSVLHACAPDRGASARRTAAGEITVAGASLYYRVIGNGPDTVIAVHGGPGFHHGYLREPLGALGDRYTVILYDGRRRGRSLSLAGDSLPLSPALDVADLEAVRSHFAVSRFAVVAHHYGGLIATRYARAYPGRVTRLAVIGPLMVRAAYNWDLVNQPQDTAATAWYAAQYRAGLPTARPHAWCLAAWAWSLAPAREPDSAVVRRLATEICDSPDSALLRRSRLKQEVLTALGNWDWRDTLTALAVPMLVIQGDRDPVLLHSGRTWAYRAGSGRFLAARGSPFFPWITDPNRVRAGLATFLGGAWPDEARRPDPADVASPDDSDRQDPATETSSSS
jgi:proline iminopeptidase